MKVAPNIKKRKELFQLPMKREELEYWGPVNQQFSNCFLTMTNDFINREVKPKTRKAKQVFISLVELVQNIAEYNQDAFKDEVAPDSYISLKLNKDEIVIRTANILIESDVLPLQAKFENVFSLGDTDLDQARDKALISGKSLGLYMIRKMNQSIFDWAISKDGGRYWLTFELRFKL